MQALTLRSDRLEVTVLPQGAALVGLRFRGQPRNMVLGFDDPADHARVPIYAGAIVGPVANRVRGGAVRIGHQRYTMARNDAGLHALHSGPEGLHAQIWQVAAHTEDHLALTCTLADGACGLPGTRAFHASYQLRGGSLTLTLQATTDQPTVVNLTAHPYWNLDGAPTVAGHSLQVHAPSYLPTDAAALPTGVITPVEGTAFDFRAPQPVPQSPALDVNYCLRPAPAADPHPAAVLKGADGTTLEIATSAPGLQVYNGAFLPKDAPRWRDGPTVAPYAAIALEPQHWPDAPHHAHFPAITLMPKSRYRQVTRYDLTQLA